MHICVCKIRTFLFWECCSPATEVFFSHFRPRGKHGGRGYVAMRVWILAELRSDALSVQHR